ncbi:protein kinase-like domain-containing protein [Xylariomycetidae sp. FL0641]|nr:protein kinase-like domain-containing protein [Xylariomycetidae sp. FL0641]
MRESGTDRIARSTKPSYFGKSERVLIPTEKLHTKRRQDERNGQWLSQLDALQEYEWDSYWEILDFEPLAKYNKGGFHPVELEEVLDERFEVIHKLGHGGYGIIWLCRDRRLEKWRALKILTADASATSKEVDILDHLRANSSPTELEENHVVAPLEHFWLDGPNGRHLCLVLPLLGCTLATWRGPLDSTDPSTATRTKNVCRQVTKGLGFLHENGVCHGDLRPSNVLMRLDEEKLDQISYDEMLELVGEPDLYPISTTTGADPRPIAPEDADLLTDEVAIIDFGEAYMTNDPPRETGIPNRFAAPEVLFKCGVGPAADIWSNRQLLGGGHQGSAPERIAHEIEALLGPLPQPYRSAWNQGIFRQPRTDTDAISGDGPLPDDHEPVFGSSGNIRITRYTFAHDTDYEDIFDAIVGKKREKYARGPDYNGQGPMVYKYSKDETFALGSLLRGMLKYSPDERWTIKAVARSPWLSDGRDTEEEPPRRYVPGFLKAFKNFLKLQKYTLLIKCLLRVN